MAPIAHDSKEISQCNIHLRNNGVSLRVYQMGSVGNGKNVYFRSQKEQKHAWEEAIEGNPVNNICVYESQ